MENISLYRLGRIARGIVLIGGIPAIIAMNSVPYFISGRLKGTEAFKEAIELLRNHSEVIKCLGEPIKDHRIICEFPENFTKEGPDNNWFRVPLSGPKGKGLLAVTFSERYDREQKTEVRKLLAASFVPEDNPDYQLILKRNENVSTPSNNTKKENMNMSSDNTKKENSNMSSDNANK